MIGAVMFEHLKAIARRLLQRGTSEWPPFSPGDPDSSVRQPRRRGPGGHSSAAAVPEPDPESFVAALGQQTPPRS